MKYIVANWKSNKNLSEVHQWLDNFTSENLDVLKGHVEVIIAPPYPFISVVQSRLQNYQWIHLASQDISPFGAGSYTGAVSTHNLNGLVKYCLVGHSERRHYFHESNEEIARKIELAKSSDIEPILCIRNEEDYRGFPVDFIAFEPQDAIGSGHNESIDVVIAMKKKLNLSSKKTYIYGGSVNSGNAREYLSNTEIGGVLPGKSSLDPHEFYNICLAAYTSE